MRECKSFESIVYLTKYPYQQLRFANTMGGIFEYDETQECNELYSFAQEIDTAIGCDRGLSVILFSSKMATSINTELKSYINNLKKGCCDFSKIKKHTHAKLILTNICLNNNLFDIIEWLTWINHEPNFKVYRKELLAESMRSITYASEHGITVYDAAQQLRREPILQRRYSNFRFLSSRTVLSKGLEFDCVIIDLSSQDMDAKDFYVAISRAKKQIYIITDKITLPFT